jgi:hypothetical protein
MADSIITPDSSIARAARAAHEVNSELCRFNGDAVFAWDEMSPEKQAGIINGARMAADGKTPEELHEAWMADHLANGWTRGPVKSIADKTHPCLIPYRDLPVAQRVKDTLFRTVVRAFMHATETIVLDAEEATAAATLETEQSADHSLWDE